MRYRYAIQICNKDMIYRYATKIRDTDIHVKICITDIYVIKICNNAVRGSMQQIRNKDMQYRYAIQICNQDMQHRYAVQIFVTDMRYRYAIKNLASPISPPSVYSINLSHP